jgi:hypothetical protein
MVNPVGVQDRNKKLIEETGSRRLTVITDTKKLYTAKT